MTRRVELVAAHVHFEPRVEVGRLRRGGLVDRDRDAEPVALTVLELISRDLRHARAPDAKWPSDLPHGPDADGLEWKWNRGDRRAHVANRDSNARMNPFLPLRPWNVRVDYDALTIEIEAATAKSTIMIKATLNANISPFLRLIGIASQFGSPMIRLLIY